MNGNAQVAAALGMPVPKPRKLSLVTNAPAAKPSKDVWRPSGTSEYIGQDQAKLLISMAVKSSQRRGMQVSHMLLDGPPGLGKTSMGKMLVELIAAELAAGARVPELHVVMGSTVKSQRQAALALSKLKEGDVLFVDEIHEMGDEAEELFGLAMEDNHIVVPGSSGGKSEPVEMDIPEFTLVGATTKPDKLTRPLKDRFGLKVHLDYYENDDLTKILLNAAKRRDDFAFELLEDGAAAIAAAGRGTPRVALSILDRVAEYSDVTEASLVGLETVQGAFDVIGLDSMGLDERDRNYLACVASWAGERVGLAPLSAKSGKGTKEITQEIEPYMLRAGLLSMAKGGRRLTREAYEHLFPGEQIPPLMALS